MGSYLAGYPGPLTAMKAAQQNGCALSPDCGRAFWAAYSASSTEAPSAREA